MKIFHKLLAAFSAMAVIAALVGGVGWYGLQRSEEHLSDVVDVRLPGVVALGSIMEAQNALQAAERSVLIPSLSREEREEILASFGQSWELAASSFAAYDALPRTEEEQELWSNFIKAWGLWKQKHKEMISTVLLVKDGNIENLKEILVSRRLDHIRWAAALDSALNTGAPFEGQLDPTQCNLGIWLGKFQPHNPDLAAALADLEEPHHRLHQAGGEIDRLLSMGMEGDARRLFASEIRPAMAQIEEILDLADLIVDSDISLMRSAAAVSFGDQQQAYSASNRLIDELVEVAKKLTGDSRRSAHATISTAMALAIGAVVIGVILAMILGYVLSHNIANPIKNAIRVIEKIAKGDTSERLPLGTAVDCSSIKKCGQSDCPSFGKTDPCWVTSGSFAVIKHCPKAKRGEDCRTCELFGAHTEVEELGSIIAALSNNLEQREELALAIAEGDLTRDVDLGSEHDSLGKALQTMVNSLRKILGHLRISGDQIAMGSMQIADSSQSLSQGATEQASSLEEISSSVMQMSSQTNSNAKNAVLARDLTTQARGAADNGNHQMQAMVGAMSEINEGSRSISRIIKVIDEIAFQTNLLALNAAVEAARAGVHGKGFAVVAEEVRNLAARSAKAARETADLIESSVKKTENGSRIADQTAAALDEIVVGVTQVTDLVAEIATASNDQALGLSEITQGLGQIDRVTQQNTAVAEESAAAAEELSSQAAELRSMLRHFQLKESSPLTTQQPSAPVPPSEKDSRVQDNWEILAASAQKSPPVIALDDSEFGRY